MKTRHTPWVLFCSLFLAATVWAEPVLYTADLSGLNEQPVPVATPATGWSTVTLDLEAYTMRVQAEWSDLIGNTTLAHIHVSATPGGNGPPATMLPSFVGFPLGVQSGTFDQTYDLMLATTYNPSFLGMFADTSAAAAGFKAALDEGRAYFNIHTSAFGGGEIRGNLARVPETASAGWLLGSGLMVLLAARRRRLMRSS